jgi:hypothetical protein
MFNEFELNEFSLDEEEVETPKKKDGWASDDEVDAEPESVPESDEEEEEKLDEEEEIPS